MTWMLFTGVAVQIVQTERIGTIRKPLDMKASSCGTFTVLVLSVDLVDFFSSKVNSNTESSSVCN